MTWKRGTASACQRNSFRLTANLFQKRKACVIRVKMYQIISDHIILLHFISVSVLSSISISLFIFLAICNTCPQWPKNHVSYNHLWAHTYVHIVHDVIYIYIHVCVILCINIYIYTDIFQIKKYRVHVYLYIYMCVCIYLFIYLLIYSFIYLLNHLFILFIYLVFNWSLYLYLKKIRAYFWLSYIYSFIYILYNYVDTPAHCWKLHPPVQ